MLSCVTEHKNNQCYEMDHDFSLTLALILLDQQVRMLNDNVNTLTTFTILDEQVTVQHWQMCKQHRVQLWMGV